MKIYVSGQITGCDNYKENFKLACEKVENDGYEAINPSLIELPISCTHSDYMKICFVMLDMADGIYMMKGWEKSKGATMEYRYAIAKGLRILFED